MTKRGEKTMWWRQLVSVWFSVYGELVVPPEGEEKAVPCFDTVESMQMKIILRELKSRAEKKEIEWTEIEAKKRWEAFLRKAWEDDFISRNFMLRIISNNKTKIFNNQITPKKNVKGSTKGFGSVGKTIQFDRP